MSQDNGPLPVRYRAYFKSRSDYVHFEVFLVIRETPKGAWVRLPPPLLDRWVPNGGRYCSVTKEEAVERLKRRTWAYLRRAKQNLAEAERRVKLLTVPLEELPLLRTRSE